ncbi:sugar nucleotide-binding protein [Oxalicibacterium faecigallinarum]|nr:sugar nucleotide-binding protein [Oxalicibacterium faecigallinarum]
MYGLHGRNFLFTIKRLACERDELHIVSDQISAPT